jgi:hypothetical protein
MVTKIFFRNLLIPDVLNSTVSGKASGRILWTSQWIFGSKKSGNRYSVWLWTGRPGLDPWERHRIFPLTSASRPALGPTLPPIQWVPGALSPGVKRGRGVMLTNHALLMPTLRKSRSYTSSQPNAPLWSVTGPLYLFHLFVVKFKLRGNCYYHR